MELTHYSTIYNIGHKAIEDLFKEPVIIQEKVDGSQFSFGVDDKGEMHYRSKGKVIFKESVDKMFTRAVEVADSLKDKLTPGWTFRCEYLSKPKHNALAYDRIPNNNLVVFDVDQGNQNYIDHNTVRGIALELGLEPVPLVWDGMITEVESLKKLLESKSVLGGQKIEGIVVKPSKYDLFGRDKKVLMGKYVSEEFKEVHSGEWHKANPGQGDVLQTLGVKYKTTARWNKAIMHLAESGVLEQSPRDIGPLMKEIEIDIQKECEDEIKEDLFKWAFPKIVRLARIGLPEWYKKKLMDKQFESKPDDKERLNVNTMATKAT